MAIHQHSFNYRGQEFVLNIRHPHPDAKNHYEINVDNAGYEGDWERDFKGSEFFEEHGYIKIEDKVGNKTPGDIALFIEEQVKAMVDLEARIQITEKIPREAVKPEDRPIEFEGDGDPGISAMARRQGLQYQARREINRDMKSLGLEGPTAPMMSRILDEIPDELVQTRVVEMEEALGIKNPDAAPENDGEWIGHLDPDTVPKQDPSAMIDSEGTKWIKSRPSTEQELPPMNSDAGYSIEDGKLTIQLVGFGKGGVMISNAMGFDLGDPSIKSVDDLTEEQRATLDSLLDGLESQHAVTAKNDDHGIADDSGRQHRYQQEIIAPTIAILGKGDGALFPDIDAEFTEDSGIHTMQITPDQTLVYDGQQYDPPKL